MCFLESEDGYIPTLAILISYQAIWYSSKHAKKDVSGWQGGTEALMLPQVKIWGKYCVIRVYLQLWVMELIAFPHFPVWWLFFKLATGLENHTSSQGFFLFSCKLLHIGTSREAAASLGGGRNAFPPVCPEKDLMMSTWRKGRSPVLHSRLQGNFKQGNICFVLSLVPSCAVTSERANVHHQRYWIS